MKDRELLVWLHARLENVHGENPHKDYMHKLRAIAAATPVNQDTPNDGGGCFNSADLQTELGRPAIVHGRMFRARRQSKIRRNRA